jgi:rhamnosyltransferase
MHSDSTTKGQAHVSLIVPTWNAERHIPDLLRALSSSRRPPDQVLWIDSSSVDQTVPLLKRHGQRVLVIRQEEFGHGCTRNLALEHCMPTDIVIYLTQDAVPQGTDWLSQLIAPFDDASVAVSYGRQTPRPDAHLLERHARHFNYPSQGQRSQWSDLDRLGIKGVFCSNSFAAYRVSALRSIGGFPEQLPLGEDMAAAIRLLAQGWVRVYQAEAQAVHSHNHPLPVEFRRYFDIGALLAMDPALQRAHLAASGEGLRYVLTEWRAAWQARSASTLCQIPLRAIAKLGGFHLGRRFRHLPPSWLPWLGLHRQFWRQACK